MDDHGEEIRLGGDSVGDPVHGKLAETIAGTNFGNTLGSFTVTGAGVSIGYTSPTLTVSATSLAAGATVTITYSGTVLAQSTLMTGPPAITTIDNTVVPSGSTRVHDGLHD